MADLNRIAEKVKAQRKVGVTKEGQLTDRDPKNDGTKETQKNGTTLEPDRVFA